MPYSVKLHRNIERQLQKVPQKHRERIIETIRSISIEPKLSISLHLDDNFYRIRVGIKPQKRPIDLVHYVLTDFSGEQEEQLPGVYKDTEDLLLLFLEKGLSTAQNEFHRRARGEEHEDVAGDSNTANE